MKFKNYEDYLISDKWKNVKSDFMEFTDYLESLEMGVV